MQVVVEMKNISKTFPGTKALDSVDIELRRGEVLSLLGENGAGKTTLMKILYGMLKQDTGEIYYQGKKVDIKNPLDAIDKGICMVHQHFMLVPAFSVMENIVVANEPHKGIFIDTKKAYKEVKDLIEKFNFKLNPNTKVSNLSVGEQQRVEILKALYRNSKVLILDEPTAVLTPNEVEDLFVTLDMLRKQGTSIIIITHKLKETMSIADRIAVLRDGQMIHNNVFPKNITIPELSKMMVGRQVDLETRYPAKRISEVYFSVKNLVAQDSRGFEKIKDISFDIRKGEIVGVAGVEGNGQTELLEAVTGLTKPVSGQIILGGSEVTGTAHDFLKKRIGHVPEDRTTMGLVTQMSVKNNLILGYHDNEDISKNGLLKHSYIKDYAKKCRQKYHIKAPSIDTPIKSLSGGNQQKVVIARALNRDLDVLIVAHPTRGLDISAMEYIHSQILEFRDKGKAVLLISADLDEVCTLSDRLLVLYDGKIVTDCMPDEYTKIQLGMLMTGSPLSSVKEVQ